MTMYPGCLAEFCTRMVILTDDSPGADLAENARPPRQNPEYIAAQST